MAEHDGAIDRLRHIIDACTYTINVEDGFECVSMVKAPLLSIVDEIEKEEQTLRALVAAFTWCLDAYNYRECFRCPLDVDKQYQCEDMMRGLGIEVPK